MKKLGVLLLAATCLSGCARPADMAPLNDAAMQIGVPKVDLTLYGTGFGPATVVMPDGEILNGHYVLSIGGSISTGTATAFGPRGSATVTGIASSTPMQNPWTMQAIGNRGTSLTCEGSAGGLGHGNAMCQTNKGAQYQLMF